MNKLIYVFDALCSWCYAFHPQLQKLLENHTDYDLQLVNGGMFIGESRRPALDVIAASQVQEMYKPLQEYGKAEISDKYMNDLLIGKNYYLDSERPARGICLFRDSQGDARVQLDFVHALQRGMYVDGTDPNSDAYFTNVLPSFEMDPATFIAQVDEAKYQDEAYADFKLAAEYGVDAYPQLILQTAEDTYYLIARGYTMAEDLEKRIDAIQSEKNDSDS